MKTQAIHMPRLDSVLMVEDTVKKLDYYPTKNQLWRALPKSMMWQTFNTILEYLQKSHKIVIDRKGEVVWIFADNPKTRELLDKSVPYRGAKRRKSACRRNSSKISPGSRKGAKVETEKPYTL